MWKCPKLHLYWSGVVNTINKVFQVSIPTDPKPCLLGILDELLIKEHSKQASARALFQAQIIRHWKATDSPTLKVWIAQMEDTLRLEKYIYQHKGRPHKFNKLWDPWLDSPGLSPVDLVLDRMLL